MKTENGIRQEAQIRNGKLHGEMSKYDSTGNLLSQSSYSNGLLDGKHTQYYLNGKLKYEVDFFRGKKDGILKHFTDTGQLMEYHYYESDTMKYAKIYDSKDRIVYFLSGVTYNSQILEDSIHIQLSLIHSNLDNLHVKAFLFTDESAQDTINTIYRKGSYLKMSIAADEFKHNTPLYMEVYESDSKLLYAKSELSVQYQSVSKEYFTELKTKGFRAISKMNIN